MYKNLINPKKFTENINIDNISDNILIDILRKMILIRLAEEKISENVGSGKIKCPCHLAIGQEAIGVAISMIIKKTDRAFGGHRSHAHYLALNENTYSLFAEILGKFSGCSHGMGGSMHLVDNDNGFKGSVPIVGATIPIAVGAALAAKFDNNNDISVCFFGDGACEEGVFHESLNLASNLSLPILFLCENKIMLFRRLHINLRQPSSSTARFADSHLVKNSIIDGNDVVSMYKLLLSEIKIMRNKSTPFFLETFTYRWKGHVGHREDNDVGVKRGDDLKLWKKRDPIKRLSNSMLENNIISKNDLNNLYNSQIEKVDKDWIKADKSDYPDESFLIEPLYS